MSFKRWVSGLVLTIGLILACHFVGNSIPIHVGHAKGSAVLLFTLALGLSSYKMIRDVRNSKILKR